MTNEQTYQERIGRYRIIRHEVLPLEHQASYRLRGIDPDDLWSLIWSFNDLEAAEKCLADCNEHKASFQTYALKDAGQEEFIERTAWF
jgi:hypothetical protein